MQVIVAEYQIFFLRHDVELISQNDKKKDGLVVVLKQTNFSSTCHLVEQHICLFGLVATMNARELVQTAVVQSI